MASTDDFAAELRAVERLGWSAGELHMAALHYGDVGTADDVAEHLRTGGHLSPEKEAFISVALRDAEHVPDQPNALKHSPRSRSLFRAVVTAMALAIAARMRSRLRR